MEDKKGLKRYFQLLGLYAKMDLAMLLRDTKAAILNLVADVLSNASALTGMFLLAWRFDGIGGMGKYEVLFMLSYITIITGVYQTCCAGCNVGHISRRIGRGQLEHMLMQPLPLRTQLLTEGFIPFTGSGSLLTGIVMISIAIRYLGVAVTWWWVLSLVANVVVTMTIILSQSYLLSSAAFYAPVAAEEISSFVINLGADLGQYPLSGMPRAMQLLLVFVFPSGLLGWFPSLALLGKPPLHLPYFFPAVIAAALFIAAQIFFRRGLKHYVQTGSNRYLPYGHRR